jgi:hypothetical protein
VAVVAVAAEVDLARAVVVVLPVDRVAARAAKAAHAEAVVVADVAKAKAVTVKADAAMAEASSWRT